MITAALLAATLAQAAPACSPTASALPPALAAWSEPATLVAAAAPGPAPLLEVGRAYRLRLHPAAHLRFAAAPAKPGDAATQGGLATVTIARAGTYQVALDGPAWVDLVRDGRALASAAHEHGPACTGIRKLVAFTLTPGRYTLQLAGSKVATVAVMVVAEP